MMTKDYRPYPGAPWIFEGKTHTHGSGTWAKWIEKNLNSDKIPSNVAMRFPWGN